MIEHERYFKILNDRLKEKNESLTLYVVGGFALKCYGIKSMTHKYMRQHYFEEEK